MIKGLICIDIDGTLTSVREELSEVVVLFLQTLVTSGYELLFVTGRTYSWSVHLLQKLPFNYFLAPYNGAYICSMPGNTPLATQYVLSEKLHEIEEITKGSDVALILYSALEDGEKSFFLTTSVSETLLCHIEARKLVLQDNLEEVTTFAELPFKVFSALRIFCLPELAFTLQDAISKRCDLQVAIMKDSYDARFSVVQITNLEASKGAVLRKMANYLKAPVTVACGDDYNDISMLKAADIAVAMETAPLEVKNLAHIIAPSAEYDGLIVGLQESIKRIDDANTR